MRRLNQKISESIMDKAEAYANSTMSILNGGLRSKSNISSYRNPMPRIHDQSGIDMQQTYISQNTAFVSQNNSVIGRHKASVEDSFIMGSGLIQDTADGGSTMAQAREFEDKLEARMPRASNEIGNRKYYENPLQVAAIVRAASREPSGNRSPASPRDKTIENTSIHMHQREVSQEEVRHPNFKRALDRSVNSSIPRKVSPYKRATQSTSPASRLKAQHS